MSGSSDQASNSVVLDCGSARAAFKANAKPTGPAPMTAI
jgi:hypothetical protein